MALKLHVFPAGYIQTNAFLLSDDARGEAILIDAPHFVFDEVGPLLEQSGCKLLALLLTHGHWDHMGDAARIRRETGAKVYAHADDRALIETPEVMRRFGMSKDMSLEACEVDEWIGEGDVLDFLGEKFEVRHVPGHCPGNVLFYNWAHKVAFVGDAIFQGSIGRTDLPGGDFGVLARSIRQRIYTLPDDTEIYPGHGPSTQVGIEKETNPFVPGD